MMLPRRNHVISEDAPLLPLVDILFSAAGIFLILITMLSTIKAEEPYQPEHPDLVVVCHPGWLYRIISSQNIDGIVVEKDSLKAEIQTHLLKGKTTHLVCALSSGSYDEYEMLKQILEDLQKELKHGAEADFGANLDVAWWPLKGDNPNEIKVVKVWRKEFEKDP